MGSQNIVISGATGFLGSNLAKAFADRGDQVFAVIRPESDTRRIKDLISSKKVKVFLLKEIDEVFKNERIDAVIHTATSYGRHNEVLSEIAEVNVDLPLKLLQLAQAGGVKYFINTDTFLSEQLPQTDKYYNYVKTKKDFLHRAEKLLKGSSLKFINARIYQMYGPDDNPDKFLPWIISGLLQPLSFVELTLGNQTRDFIYISDVVSAFLQILNNASYFSQFENFEIGTGIATALKEAVELAKNIIQSPTELQWGKKAYNQGEIMVSRAVVEKNRQIGWLPQVNLTEGFHLTVNYYQSKQNL